MFNVSMQFYPWWMICHTSRIFHLKVEVLVNLLIGKSNNQMNRV